MQSRDPGIPRQAYVRFGAAGPFRIQANEVAIGLTIWRYRRIAA